MIQLIACIIGTYSAPPTNQETILSFYKNVRPWSFWKPIHELALDENPDFERNKNLGNNIFNLTFGIIGQVLLMLLPMYLILNKWTGFGVVLAGIIIIFVVMKRTWWDRLADRFWFMQIASQLS